MASFSLFPDSPRLSQVFSRRRFRVRWRNNDPVLTELIIVVCVVVWILEMLFRFTWRTGYAALLDFGMFQPATALWHPWTFVTSMFLHSPSSLWHILFNMLTLWAIGPFLERLMGHWPYLILYVLSGIGGNVGMMAWAAFGSSAGSGSGTVASVLGLTGTEWYSACYGASGALFGLFAAMLVVYRKVGEDLRSALVWMIINFLMPVVIPNIAWQAHVFGFLVGGILTMLLIYGPIRALRIRPLLLRSVIYGIVMLLILVVIVVLCNTVNPLLALSSVITIPSA
ncbi:rhomboid family intramembrane serine protease [Bifidobacterium choloepi]|uniref:Rhomboid family intramembrane serine protease n=1 Tax=Bifidobacterium choloepi TaxID=2614131 RepID=A0A6I5N9W6_9BIFI|nr:rhomboid family intramembrane serine protease [Bifidobacterium choloepi]NEG70581.1 rhomboid family intramembrane serine protease [Bifidobacterium choloepi]